MLNPTCVAGAKPGGAILFPASLPYLDALATQPSLGPISLGEDEYYVLGDNHGIARRDLLQSVAEGVNAATEKLASFGVPFPKRDGAYVRRSKRSIAMHGERLKPIQVRAVSAKRPPESPRQVPASSWRTFCPV